MNGTSAPSICVVVTLGKRLQPARAIVGAVLLIGWFVVTNHCGLGLMKPASPEAHAHCANHDSQHQGSGSPKDGVLDCCKKIQAALIGDGKVALDYQWHLVGLHLFVMWTALEVEDYEFDSAPGELDTGPPFSLSFAELVLQRSFFSHAPPIV